MRYCGCSRLDDDMHFLSKTTDQLVTVGSDFPEYSPADALARLATLTQGIDVVGVAAGPCRRSHLG